jgi:2-dehydro-3-deoxy-D-arabinonate dehydratase
MFAVSRLADGLVIESGTESRLADPSLSIDLIFTSESPMETVALAFRAGEPSGVVTAVMPPTLPPNLLAPIESQEVWAAGVTYSRSKVARMEESRDAGGGSFYDKVYDADRPELFFKSTAARIAGPGDAVRIRRDSAWNVPEPELTLAINVQGLVFGYTAGNDMSSRDIEGENPLYLPQAKIYYRSAAIGPRLVVSDELPSPATMITLTIVREGVDVFAGRTDIGRIRRPLQSLADWLYLEDKFPNGCYLMTGTGIVPDDDFTLHLGDEIHIHIDGVGTLVNHVER